MRQKLLFKLNLIFLFLFYVLISCNSNNKIDKEKEIYKFIDNISDNEVVKFEGIRVLSRYKDSSGIVINSFFKTIKDTIVEIPNFNKYKIEDSIVTEEFNLNLLSSILNKNKNEIKIYSDSIFNILNRVNNIYAVDGERKGIIFFYLNRNDYFFYINEDLYNLDTLPHLNYIKQKATNIKGNWYVFK